MLEDGRGGGGGERGGCEEDKAIWGEGRWRRM